MSTDDNKWLYKDLTYEIIGMAMEVHNELGNGFLEYLYEEALCYELRLRGIPFQRQVEIDIYYKDHLIPKKYRADLVVDGKVVVEIKATSGLTKVDEAQLIHYLKATKYRLELLFNFGKEKLEKRRIIL